MDVQRNTNLQNNLKVYGYTNQNGNNNNSFQQINVEVETAYFYRKVKPLVWAVAATIFLGISYFCIGLSSYYDSVGLPPILLNATALNNAEPREDYKEFITYNKTHSIEPLFKNVINDTTKSLLRFKTLLVYIDRFVFHAGNETVWGYKLFWRQLTDLSLLWLTNGICGLVVGVYLWGSFGGLFFSSPELDIIFPNMGPDDPSKKNIDHFGSLFQQNKIMIDEEGTDGGKGYIEMLDDTRVNTFIEAFDQTPRGILSPTTSHSHVESLYDSSRTEKGLPTNIELNNYQTGNTDQGIYYFDPLNKESNRRYPFSTQTQNEEIQSREKNILQPFFWERPTYSSNPNLELKQARTMIEKKNLYFFTPFIPIESFFTITMIVIGGVTMAAAQAALKFSFCSEPSMWGPLSSLSACEGILVSGIFRYGFYVIPDISEQIILFCMFLSACAMPVVDAQRSVHTVFFIYGVMSAIFMAGTVTSTRIGSYLGVPGITGFSIRCLAQGCLGLIGLTITLLTGQGRQYLLLALNQFCWSPTSERFWCYFGSSLCAGIMQAFSIGCLNIALKHKESDNLSALLPLHSLTVTLMTWSTFHALPSYSLLCGMIIIWSCCCGLLVLSNWKNIELKKISPTTTTMLLRDKADPSTVLTMQYPTNSTLSDPLFLQFPSSEMSYYQNHVLPAERVGRIQSHNFCPFSLQVPSIVQASNIGNRSNNDCN